MEMLLVFVCIHLMYLNILLFFSFPQGGFEKQNECNDQEEEEPLATMTFNFNIESLGLVLYSDDPKQVAAQRFIDAQSLKDKQKHSS